MTFIQSRWFLFILLWPFVVIGQDASFLEDYNAQKFAFRSIEVNTVKTYLERIGKNHQVPQWAKEVDFYQCLGPSWYVADNGTMLSNASSLAMVVGNVEGILTAYKIPEHYWRGEVLAFEKSIMQKLNRGTQDFWRWFEGERDEFGKSLVDHLNKNATKSSPLISELQFHYIGGCGAGEDSFYVKSDPPQASLILVPRWNYLYCKALQHDPFSKNSNCAGKRLAPPTYVSVVGSYHYKASWPNGDEAVGYIDFSNRSDADALVTISPRGYAIK